MQMSQPLFIFSFLFTFEFEFLSTKNGNVQGVKWFN
ncbi:hypothetical protein PB1_15339 [Bacillus methanolicus PB1]|uniref:Uncharacterized protein n=1 Tax=Bacillus methanolicus PB1 TaxID=997296 RepID=I3DXH3_BACMT|nr:hypothetical protein PB1_15339 [Bacillus methanolicus PB1]